MKRLEHWIPFVKDAAKSVKRICLEEFKEVADETLTELQRTKAGRIRGAISYGPCALEPHHPDFFWYGIHATEALFTIMGTGCQTVVRTATADTDVTTGTWSDGRTGIMYGLHPSPALAHARHRR